MTIDTFSCLHVWNMTLRFYDGGSFKILAAKPLVHWFFLLACLVFRALLLLPFAVVMDSYVVLASTNLTSTSMTMTTWVPTTGTPPQCIRDDCSGPSTEVNITNVEPMCNETGRTESSSWVAYTMGFCKWRTYQSLVERPDKNCFLLKSNQECSQCLKELLQLEADIKAMYEEYEGIIERFDCTRSYSMWNCTDCKVSKTKRKWWKTYPSCSLNHNNVSFVMHASLPFNSCLS